jgi:hypothetical protein
VFVWPALCLLLVSVESAQTFNNSLAIASLGSRRLASPIRCEGHDAGSIMSVVITGMKLLEYFLGDITRFQQ